MTPPPNRPGILPFALRLSPFGATVIPAAAGALLLTAVLSGLALMARPSPPAPDLVVWTFAASHAEAFGGRSDDGKPSLTESFRRRTGRSVGVELMAQRSLDLRLMTLLQDATPSDALPDIVHLETLSAAKFLDAPRDNIGLLPLDERLADAGLLQGILPATLAAWQRHGQVFGVPYDVHPVTLTYRRDLFDEAGLDPSAAATWPELAEVLRKYCQYWAERGHPGRRALELARTRSDHLTLMLQQRGVPLADELDRPNLDDPRVAAVLSFYVELLAGAPPVAMPTSEGHARWAQDFERGDVAMVWTPGWRMQHLEAAAPELKGRLAMMPLPRFEAGDARTALWGGSMLAIPRHAPDPDAAWELLVHLALSEEARARRAHTSSSLAPMIDPQVDETSAPQSLLPAQPARQLYAELAAEAPPQRLTTLSTAAAAHLAAIISRAAEAREAGAAALEVEADIRQWLAAAQHDLERRAAFAARDDPTIDVPPSATESCQAGLAHMPSLRGIEYAVIGDRAPHSRIRWRRPYRPPFARG